MYFLHIWYELGIACSLLLHLIRRTWKTSRILDQPAGPAGSKRSLSATLQTTFSTRYSPLYVGWLSLQKIVRFGTCAW